MSEHDKPADQLIDAHLLMDSALSECEAKIQEALGELIAETGMRPRHIDWNALDISAHGDKRKHWLCGQVRIEINMDDIAARKI